LKVILFPANRLVKRYAVKAFRRCDRWTDAASSHHPSGWFGFNAGSALAADGLAATAFLNTMLAGGTGMIGWLVVEQRREGKPTTLGITGLLATGLLAVRR